MSDEGFRPPPQNLEAERGVLGSLLVDPGVIADLAAFLRPEHFFREQHRVVYHAAIDLFDAGKPVDVISVAEELERLGMLRQAGGFEALAEYAGLVPHAANASHYGSIVQQKAVVRSLIDASTETLRDCYGGTLSAEQLLDLAEERVFSLGEHAAVGRTRPVGDAASDAMDRISRRSEGYFSGVETGFVEFDHLTDGLADGSLVVLAARPSMGKTAWALQVAESVALAQGEGVLFVSLEMGDVELAERLLVSGSRVDGYRVRTGQALSGADMGRLAEAYGTLRRSAKLWIDDTATRTVTQVAANARRFRSRQAISLVIVDYIQLIDGGEGRESRQEQVAKISRRLKVLAKELRCPVLALSQLNRNAEAREDRRPRMADLRESGAIEQDADMVLLLHRPEYYDPNDQPGVAELIIAKNRHGSIGTSRLTFLKHLGRFENLAPQLPPEGGGDVAL